MSRIFPVLLLSLALLFPALPLRAAEGLPATPQAAVDALSLERDIHALMRDKKALAGVALLTEDGLCAGVHMDTPFPLLSVIKFPLAVAVLEKMQQEHTPLTARIPVRAGQLHPDTHSPLRDKYGQRDVRLSLQELLHATITFSDNNGCDILMEYVGGPSVVEACARRLGADSVFIGHNEDWMHQNIYNQYANWGTPRSMARMLLGFFSSPDIPQAHKDFMTGIMAKTPARPGKILEPDTRPVLPTGRPRGSSLRTTTWPFSACPMAAMWLWRSSSATRWRAPKRTSPSSRTSPACPWTGWHGSPCCCGTVPHGPDLLSGIRCLESIDTLAYGEPRPAEERMRQAAGVLYKACGLR